MGAPVDRTRDDRVLPETRWAALVVCALLVAAWALLWILPSRTEDLWAWPIAPDASAIFLGSAYGAGAYFFARLFRSQSWHPASAGLAGAAVLATLILVSTLVHWDRFNQGDGPTLAAIAFYLWVATYLVTPFLFLGLWLRNRRTDPVEPEPRDPDVPAAIRAAARVFAVAAAAAAALFLLWPDQAAEIWPWELTPLTSRVPLGSVAATLAMGALLLSFDRRWSAWRLLVETFLVAALLLLAGAAGSWDDFDKSDPVTWGYLGSLVGVGLALAALHRSMERRAGT